jgi:hypothetical protein
MLIRNPVKRHMHKSVRASIVLSKQRKLKSEATLRDAAQSLSGGILDSGTITFVSGSTVCWDESEDCCESVLNSVNCSSVSIDDCEED